MSTTISVQVFAEKRNNVSPAYRVWIDDTLLVEREFWPDPDKVFINEKLFVDLGPGEHFLKLENVPKKPGSKVWMVACIINDIEHRVKYTLQPIQIFEFAV